MDKESNERFAAFMKDISGMVARGEGKEAVKKVDILNMAARRAVIQNGLEEQYLENMKQRNPELYEKEAEIFKKMAESDEARKAAAKEKEKAERKAKREAAKAEAEKAGE